MTSAALPPSAAAVNATQLLVKFLTKLRSTVELTPENAGKMFGVSLSKGNGESIYRSADLGGGWNYGVKVLPSRKAMKAGFEFWFYNPDRTADPSPVCGLSLDALRQSLVAHGFVEQFSPSEIGGIDWINFVKNDIVLTVTRRDVVAMSGGSPCLISLQTADGI